jgi:hypothetical protein
LPSFGTLTEPGGLAVGRYGHLYVSSHSREASAGQVLRIELDHESPAVVGDDAKPDVQERRDLPLPRAAAEREAVNEHDRLP